MKSSYTSRLLGFPAIALWERACQKHRRQVGMPGGEQPCAGWGGKDHDFHAHPTASAKARPQLQRIREELFRGVKGSTAEFQGPDSLCGLRFNCIVPLKTMLLVGVCALGINLAGVCSAALAEEGGADPPQPHWSHLPVWGGGSRGPGIPAPASFGDRR
jgi:hypothetical protein